MATFNFDGARRWARFEAKRTLSRREDSQLPFICEEDAAGKTLLLDTTTYIDRMQGRVPPIVNQSIDSQRICHSTVAIQELMHTVGALDPGDARTDGVIEVIRDQIQAMLPHRVFAPDADVLGRAALLAGILCRLQGYGRENRYRALHDCVLFLQARKLGLTVLTGNVSDFDFLLQLMPAGRVLMYRQMRA